MQFLSKTTWVSITPEVFHLYMPYFVKTPQKASEYAFVGLTLWRDFYSLRYIANEELFFIQDGNGIFWAPQGNWYAVDWKQYMFSEYKAQFMFVPEELVVLWKQIFGSAIQVEEDRNSWDYLYAMQELAELPGSKFTKKRNHINNFMKYAKQFSFRAITEDSAVKIADTYATWIKNPAELTPVLRSEKQSMEYILRNWSLFPSIAGYYIEIEGQIRAFAFGEALSEDTFVVQIEKAEEKEHGIYQAVNKLFAEQLLSQGYQYSNRGDDVGVIGLREAKLSYHPVNFVKKYTVHFL